jgi:L-alanine-DL-glutamate epimerase-like enolase superfamily enzyme
LVDHALVRNENGWLDIPIRPGLGLEINRDCLKHFTTASHTIGG